MGVFDPEKDNDDIIKYSLLSANICKENNKYTATLFCGQKDGKVDNFVFDFKQYREIANYLWKKKVGWSHKSFVSFLDKDSNTCFIWKECKNIQKTAQMVGRVVCNELLQNIDALMISSTKYYDAVFKSLSEIDIKLLNQKQNVNILKIDNEDFISLKEKDNDFSFSVKKKDINKNFDVHKLHSYEKKEIENLPVVCFLDDSKCNIYGKSTKNLIQFMENKPLFKQYCIGLYSNLKSIVPNHTFLDEIKEDYECGQLYMKAYVADGNDGEHLAMVCNQDGDLSSALIKVKDSKVTDIFFDGKFHKINEIDLDTETAQYGKLWRFKKPFTMGFNTIETVRVIDIAHNMFEIVGGKALAPSSVKEATLEEVERSVFTGDVPVIISDWGKRDFDVVGRVDRQVSVMPKPKVKKLAKLKVEKSENENLFDMDTLDLD